MIEISKKDLNGKIEPFLYQELDQLVYQLSEISANSLLTYNRFDLGFKLAYLSLKDTLPEFAKEIYYNDILSQTLGKFEEFGNKDKDSFQNYLKSFHSTFNSIKKDGFNENITLIPLCNENTIINGAHRIASSIFLDKKVNVIQTELKTIYPNYKYFIDRKVPEEILDLVATKFAQFASNTYLAFLWPSGRENYSKTEILFTKVVYKKKIKLNRKGGLNLLIELYKHMEWLGAIENNFPGAHQKLIECFKDFEEFTVIMFQSDNLKKVQEIKKKVRDINQIGFSSVHITDTSEELVRITKLIFNNNGLHFLNFGNPYKYRSTQEMLCNIESIDWLDREKTIFDGSMTLSVYGIREARDIDYLSISNITPKINKYDIEPHDSEINYHKLNKKELIFNPKYYFEYLGTKIVSFNQLYEFKKNRNEKKDSNDLKIMKSYLENNGLQYFISRFRQFIFYKKLDYKNRCKNFLLLLLKYSGTYKTIKYLYTKIRRNL